MLKTHPTILLSAQKSSQFFFFLSLNFVKKDRCSKKMKFNCHILNPPPRPSPRLWYYNHPHYQCALVLICATSSRPFSASSPDNPPRSLPHPPSPSLTLTRFHPYISPSLPFYLTLIPPSFPIIPSRRCLYIFPITLSTTLSFLYTFSSHTHYLPSTSTLFLLHQYLASIFPFFAPQFPVPFSNSTSILLLFLCLVSSLFLHFHSV